MRKETDLEDHFLEKNVCVGDYPQIEIELEKEGIKKNKYYC